MIISEVIEKLQKIHSTFGDTEVYISFIVMNERRDALEKNKKEEFEIDCYKGQCFFVIQ